MTDANKLAESLRAMRRNARNAYVSARPGASYSITIDAVRLGDLSDAADLIEKIAAELAEWRSVFGPLGATPDDCGNVIAEKFNWLQRGIEQMTDALMPLANAAAQIERETLTDADVERAQVALYGKAVP